MRQEDRDRLNAAMAGIPLAPLLGMVWQRPSQRVMEQQAKRWTAKGRPAYVENTPDLVDEFWGEVNRSTPLYRKHFGQGQDALVAEVYAQKLRDLPAMPGFQDKVKDHLWNRYEVPTMPVPEGELGAWGQTRFTPRPHIFIDGGATGALGDLTVGHEGLHAAKHLGPMLRGKTDAYLEPQAEMSGALLRYVASGGRTTGGKPTPTQTPQEAIFGPIAYSSSHRPSGLTQRDRKVAAGFAREVFGDTRGSVLKFGTPPPRMRGKSAIGLAALSALAGGGAYLWNRLNDR